MFGTALVFCALLGAGPDAVGAPVTSNPDRAAYERARRETGRDAAAHVRLALWCEAHGMSAERMKHLAAAVMYDPSHPLARGLLGLVAYRGKWGRPEDIARRMQEDPAHRALIGEYLERRAKASEKAESQMRLAAWCEEKGLQAQAIAHYTAAIRLDPTREAAWRKLGYKKAGNRWVRPEQEAARKQEAERQRRADKAWRPRLEGLRRGIESPEPSKRSRAEQALADVTDPRALPAIWSVFVVGGGERSQIAASQVLGQIDGAPASIALATMALSLPDGSPRARAIETLIRRDPRDVVDRLIALVRKPFAYRVRPIYGMGSVGELFLEGEDFNVYRAYRSSTIEPALLGPNSVVPSLIMSALNEAETLSPQAALLSAAMPDPQFDPSTYIVALAADAARTPQEQKVARRMELFRQENQVLRERMAADIREVEAINASIKQVNERVLPLLAALTGQQIGAEPTQWKNWWSEQVGVAVRKKRKTAMKPTFSEVVDSPNWLTHNSCFGAGTPVMTVDGPRAIESIRVGDRVLSQDAATGELRFRPVLAVHESGPAATLRIGIGEETIVATGIHRFWKAGKGWVMARDLKPGDRLRGVGEVVEVRSVASEAVQPVYNLDVAEDRDFFVGGHGLLVHDFSFVQPVAAPFDREPELPSKPTAVARSTGGGGAGGR